MSAETSPCVWPAETEPSRRPSSSGPPVAGDGRGPPRTRRCGRAGQVAPCSAPRGWGRRARQPAEQRPCQGGGQAVRFAACKSPLPELCGTAGKQGRPFAAMLLR